MERAQARLRWRAAQGGTASSSAEGVPLLQQQQQQQVVLQDTYYESRSEALQNVESTIVELGGIFQQLAHMVHHWPCAAAISRTCLQACAVRHLEVEIVVCTMRALFDPTSSTAPRGMQD